MPFPELADEVNAILNRLDEDDFDSERASAGYPNKARADALAALREYRSQLRAERDLRTEVPDGTFRHTLTHTIGDVDVRNHVTLEFTWHGGAYMEVGTRGRGAAEVIHVWDHATDQPRIERTIEAMEAKVYDWIDSYGERGDEDLLHDALNNWYV